ncbi:diacylglycerol kinase family protein [Mucilaginibacter sp. UR6-11]|uniref:diacylglycerol/lipid kinase family protein n=1 Tax=Mucilaginibacter sp. UR6-11 TaxID=1435644 RepID=UPI001E45523C|nr:diacylglycerol kinase family protein [Mucilaginibacter sp. UR6-11]MCC8425312.1 diacylglycerol kinase family lipid kinase [Mucilaginibacter sp. UR6-11]
MKRKTLFIINPISGGKKKDGVPELINACFKGDATTIFTNGVSHASEVAAGAVDDYDLIVAVGGDGTVNEIASALVGSKAVLGIVPCGSGNGLSRFLGIPMDIKEAIENLNEGKVAVIDSARANGKPFFNMAGMGFDAHISEVFSHGKKRGFITYIKSSLQEIFKYEPQAYHIEIDGTSYERKAFMLSFANSSQYGNNAHVSPQASVQDGLLDVCVIKPFPLYRFIELGIRMFTKTTNKSRFVEIIRGKHIVIRRNSPGPMHLDGEPEMAGTEIEINILPQSLNVIVGKDFK